MGKIQIEPSKCMIEEQLQTEYSVLDMEPIPLGESLDLNANVAEILDHVDHLLRDMNNEHSDSDSDSMPDSARCLSDPVSSCCDFDIMEPTPLPEPLPINVQVAWLY